MKSKNPTYFIQKGFRNGSKTTSKNVARIGKHSELLRITDDTLSYAKEQAAEYNREEKDGRVSIVPSYVKPAFFNTLFEAALKSKGSAYIRTISKAVNASLQIIFTACVAIPFPQ